MKKLFSGVLIAASVLFMSGCMSINMVKAPSQEIGPPSPGKAKIVFLRSAFVGGGVGIELFETTRGKVVPIGGMPNNSKFVIETTPGKKVYMAYGRAADFMLANVVAGKVYYVIVRPNAWTGGQAPTPIRNNGTTNFHTNTEEFKGWINSTEIFELADDLNKWYNKERQTEMEAVYKDYWSRFQNKSPAEMAQRTLNPEDGT